jgi:hypothetical protein
MRAARPLSSMRSIREEDDGREFNVDLYHAHVRQALDLKQLAAGARASEALGTLQRQLADRRRQPAEYSRSRSALAHDASATIDSEMPNTFTSKSATALTRSIAVSGSAPDYEALGRQYKDSVAQGSLAGSASSPMKMLQDDMRAWRSKRMEVETILGQNALALPPVEPRKRLASRGAAPGSAGSVPSLDPTGRLSAANNVRSIHQMSRIKLAALEQGLDLTRSAGDFATSATLGNTSGTLGPMSPLGFTAVSAKSVSVFASPTSHLTPDETTWCFEEERMRREVRKTIRAEAESLAFLVTPTPKRVRDRHTSELTERLKQLQQELISPASFRRQPRARTRYGHHRELLANATANIGDDDAAAAGQRKGKHRGDELSRWVAVPDVPLHAMTETGEPFCEWEMHIPEQDLHLYQLYCYYTRSIIVIRPVSSSVPALNAGNFFLHAKYCDSVGQPLPQPHLGLEQILAATTHDSRVRGKSINVSLKSSTYPPIDGLIPVNPGLGKAYLEAQRREREIEDMILNAKGGVVTITLLKKLKTQKAQAGSLTQAFRRDIETALIRSNTECAALLEQYKADLVLTVDKGAVSQQYIDRFNEAQYLGTTNALWRGLSVYYAELPNGAVVRNERDVPYFYVKKAGMYYQFLPDQMDIAKMPESDHSNFKPVLVVTHRMFFVSPTTQRIEEDPESYLIGPDFDGLCYAVRDTEGATLNDRVQWAYRTLELKLIRSMGIVNDADIQHVREVRELTEWKQNHGYEATNTVKTQPLTPGPYVVITPDLTSVVKDVQQIIGLYRTAWKARYPLILNPNWRVAIDSDHLPRLYGEDLVLPIVDDCGYASLMSRFDAGEGGGVTHDQIKAQYHPMAERLKLLEDERAKNARKFGNNGNASVPRMCPDEDLDITQHLFLVYDRKYLAGRFFEVRRWQLLPPWRNAAAPVDTATEEEVAEAELHVDPEFELFRLEEITPRLAAFEEAARHFRELHGPMPFVDLLQEYLSPEADTSATSSLASSLGSLADFVF